MKKETLGCAVALLLACGLAHANEGRVCTSGAAKPTQTMKPLDAATAFTCEGMSGTHTISSIYAKGWAVAHLVPFATVENGQPSSHWVLIIEKR
jgi:hypothetical protein